MAKPTKRPGLGPVRGIPADTKGLHGSPLNAFFRGLNATGAKGFEGLVCAVAERWTGWRFRLAKSGYQAGRDAATPPGQACLVAIESKRYTNSRLDDRDLLGELTQCHRDIPGLDVWILATIAPISDQLGGALHALGKELGIDVVTIGGEGPLVSDIEVFLAAQLDVVLSFAPDELRPGIRADLERCRAATEFSQRAEGLRLNLMRLGLPAATEMMREAYLRQVSEEAASRAAFGQALNVSAKDTKFVPRTAPAAALDSWWRGFPRNGWHRLLCGLEGVGKTWLVFRWTSEVLMRATEPPMVVPLTWKTAGPLGDPATLIASRLEATSDHRTAADWRRKIRMWLSSTDHARPYFLLILDGINERQDLDWKSLYRALDVDPWRGRVAVIATSRPFMATTVMREVGVTEARTIDVGDYSDPELRVAFELAGATIGSSLSPAVKGLIRRPRYCDRVLRLPAEEWASLSVEQLLLSDWRDRRGRSDKLELNQADFHGLLAKAAMNMRERQPVGRTDVHSFLPPFLADRTSAMQDLVDGNAFEDTSGPLPRLRLRPEFFALGLGVLLVDELCNEDTDIGARLAEFLAAFDGTDHEAEILAVSAFICAGTGVRDTVQDALGRAFFGARNLPERVADSLRSLGLADVDFCVRQVEYFWSEASENAAAQERIAAALFHARTHGNIELLSPHIHRWVGIVCPQGFKDLRSLDGYQQECSENLRALGLDDAGVGIPEELGLRSVDDDGLLRLHKLALLLVSGGDPSPFSRSLCTLHLSRAAMASYAADADAAWMFCFSGHEARAAALELATAWAADRCDVMQHAAYGLLSAISTDRALAQRSTLSRPRKPNRFEEKYRDDPCSSPFAWSREHLKMCSACGDLDGRQLAFRLSKWAADPSVVFAESCVEKTAAAIRESDPGAVFRGARGGTDFRFRNNLAPMAARLAPADYSKWFSHALSTLEDEPLDELRDLIHALDRHLLLLNADSHSALDAMWRNAIAPVEPYSAGLLPNANVIELLLFTAILASVEPLKGFHALLRRPAEAFDGFVLEPLFGSIPTDQLLSVLDDESLPRHVRTRALWYFAATIEEVPASAKRWLIDHLHDDDDTVRVLVHRVIDKANDAELSSACLRAGFAYPKPQKSQVDALGTRILARCQAASYAQVSGRLSAPGKVAFVSEPGRPVDEVLACADELDAEWRAVTLPATNGQDTALPEVDVSPHLGTGEPAGPVLRARSRSVTFVSKGSFWGGELDGNDTREGIRSVMEGESLEELLEQEARIDRAWNDVPTSWWGIPFSKRFFDRLIDARPSMVRAWAEAAISGAQRDRIWSRAQTFYVALSRAAIAADWQLGQDLWRHARALSSPLNVRDSSGVSWFALAAFESDSDATKPLRSELFETASSDAELLELALCVGRFQREKWLQTGIDEISATGQAEPVRHAQTRVLAAFTGGRFHDRAGPGPQPASFDARVRDACAEFRRTDNAARHWFVRLLNAESASDAWGALELFLEVVDPRFDAWGADLLGSARHPKRNRFVRVREQLIRTRLKKKWAEYRETFCGEKVKMSQVRPFARAPRLVVR